MTRSSTIRICSRALALVGVATVLASANGSVSAVAPPPLMVDAQVIAQGVIEFDDSPIVWSVSAASLPPNTEADIDADRCGFLHVTGGMLDVDVDDELVRLAAGEAMMLRPGDDAGLSVSGLETVTGWQIMLADGERRRRTDRRSVLAREPGCGTSSCCATCWNRARSLTSPTASCPFSCWQRSDR